MPRIDLSGVAEVSGTGSYNLEPGGYVMVVTDLEAEELEMRPVTVLAESGSSAAVEGDLAEGDMVQIVYAWDTGLEGEGDYETMAG